MTGKLEMLYKICDFPIKNFQRKLKTCGDTDIGNSLKRSFNGVELCVLSSTLKHTELLKINPV